MAKNNSKQMAKLAELFMGGVDGSGATPESRERVDAIAREAINTLSCSPRALHDMLALLANYPDTYWVMKLRIKKSTEDGGALSVWPDLAEIERQHERARVLNTLFTGVDARDGEPDAKELAERAAVAAWAMGYPMLQIHRQLERRGYPFTYETFKTNIQGEPPCLWAKPAGRVRPDFKADPVLNALFSSMDARGVIGEANTLAEQAALEAFAKGYPRPEIYRRLKERGYPFAYRTLKANLRQEGGPSIWSELGLRRLATLGRKEPRIWSPPGLLGLAPTVAPAPGTAPEREADADLGGDA